MVIDQPQMPQDAKASTKKALTTLGIFVVVGIFLSVVVVAGGALIDRSLRFPIDVRHGLSLPVLAMVPIAQMITLSPTSVEQPASVPVVSTDAL
jgi:capsular polysaccharide biosynthesis protein